MPTIATFYGIIIRMFFLDTKHHNMPHVHVEYQGENAVVLIPSGELLEGSLPARKVVQIRHWMTLREEMLMENWARAVRGEPVFAIPP